MVYITGDRHGSFYDIFHFCFKNKTSLNDYLIMLGDSGINYYRDKRDDALKFLLSALPITLVCISGNHEEKAENISSYNSKYMFSNEVLYEDAYPNILFLKDGEIYNIEDKSVFVLGGAYSIDKNYRLNNNLKWYESEQPNDATKEKAILNLISHNNMVDVVLSHTCPYKYIPKEAFVSGVDQSLVDNSTEIFLNYIENTIKYDQWYCGHFHINKDIDRMKFLSNNIESFQSNDKVRR